MIRMSGIGNILGYLAGNVKLPDYLPFLGGTQFKVLCAIASIIMALTVAISCTTVHERDPRFDGPPPDNQDSVLAFFKSLYKSVNSLPPQIRRVCEVQFFAWIGWFPFLFYITTYVGEIYVEPHFEADPNLPDEKIDQLWEEATRVGTRALLIFAITTFIASVILPFIIPPTYEAPQPRGATTPRTPMTPMATTPGSMSGSGYFALKAPEKKSLGRAKTRVARYLEMLQIQSLTLRRAWMLSHLVFAGLMCLTFFVRSTLTATILVAFIGIPWTLTNWAPFALISSEISKREAIRRGLLRPSNREASLIAAGEDEAGEENADKAGVVLGIHNVAIAAPQVIATLASSLIFKMLQKPRGTPGDNSVAWVLRFGGCCAIVAAWLTLRVHEEKEDAELAAADAEFRFRRES
jgi:solute carrier family 45 protein 1/2/4